MVAEAGGHRGSLERIAELLRTRNKIDESIAEIIRRPMASGHLGEWIAAAIFDIRLESSANATAIDGRFRSGPLENRTVNIKWYLRRDGVLDMTRSEELDHYLVLTGPRSAAISSKNTTRPWCIEAVYLFDARQLLSEQLDRGIKIGVASSVRDRQWLTAEIYPKVRCDSLPLSAAQLEMLRMWVFEVNRAWVVSGPTVGDAG